MSIKANIQALVSNLEHLDQVVQVPDGDYSNTALNSSEIFPRLAPQAQHLLIEVVDFAFETLTQYGDDDRKLNTRAQRELCRHGGARGLPARPVRSVQDGGAAGLWERHARSE